MNALRLMPVVLGFLLLGAHFYRAGLEPVAWLCIALPLLLFVRRWWVARLMQAGLALGALEWVRTLVMFAAARQMAGQPWTRLAIILGAVALFTGLSALVFQGSSLRERYGLTRRNQAGPI